MDALTVATLVRALTTAGEWRVALDLFEQVARASEADVEEGRRRRSTWRARGGGGGASGGGRAAGTTWLTSACFAAALEASAAGADPERGRGWSGRCAACACTRAPSATSYLAKRAHANAGDWRGAVSTWQDVVREGMMVDKRMWEVVYAACRKARREEEARMLAEYAEREGMPMMLAVEEGEEEAELAVAAAGEEGRRGGGGVCRP